MAFNLKLLDDTVAIEPEKPADKTEGGIHLPEGARRSGKGDFGTVLGVGPGRLVEDGSKRVPMSVAVGQRVLYSRRAGQQIEHEDQQVIFLSEDGILAIVE